MSGERRLRVLHVIDSLAEGGAEQNLLTLVRNLGPPYEHHIAWLYDDERLRSAFAPYMASMLALGAGRQWDLVRVSLKLTKHMRRLRPDVVSAKLIRAHLVARVAAGLSGGIPCVSTWECVSYTPDMYADLGRWGTATRVLDVLTGLREAHFVAVSRQVADHNARVLRVDPGRVSVIYNAVDPTRVVPKDPSKRESFRREIGVQGGAPVLLSVGRLGAQKDHATSIRAMAGVVRTVPGAVLAIAGDGYLRPVLEANIHALGLRDRVRLLGHRTDVPALLRAADLFVFPSLYEGLGIALMEALAAGLPAVSSLIDTSVEVAGGSRAVRYFPPGNAEALSTTIVHALEDLPALTAAAAADAARICGRFSPAAMARRYDAVFRAAVASGGRSWHGAVL